MARFGATPAATASGWSATARWPSSTSRRRPGAQVSRDTRERPAQRKLSYKLQRELDALPDQIATLEKRVAELRVIVNDAGFYQRPHGEVQESLDALRDAEREVEVAVDRWGELEEQAAAAASGDAS